MVGRLPLEQVVEGSSPSPSAMYHSFAIVLYSRMVHAVYPNVVSGSRLLNKYSELRHMAHQLSSTVVKRQEYLNVSLMF